MTELNQPDLLTKELEVTGYYCAVHDHRTPEVREPKLVLQGYTLNVGYDEQAVEVFLDSGYSIVIDLWLLEYLSQPKK